MTREELLNRLVLCDPDHFYNPAHSWVMWNPEGNPRNMKVVDDNLWVLAGWCWQQLPNGKALSNDHGKPIARLTFPEPIGTLKSLLVHNDSDALAIIEIYAKWREALTP